MISIFDYDDYRVFVKDYIAAKNAKGIRLSLRQLTAKLGISSTSYLSRVLSGHRNLSKENAEKLAHELQLSGDERKYFLLLVRYCGEEDKISRKALFEELLSQRQSSEDYKLRQSQYKYFSEWYYPVIRHIAAFADWRNNYDLLASLVQPHITSEQAQKAIEDLLKLGLIIKTKDRYELNAPVIRTDSIPFEYKEKGRSAVLQHGMESVKRYDTKQRHTSFYTLAVTKDSHEKILEHYKEFEKKMFHEVKKSEGADVVRQVIFQSFPISKEFDS